MYAYIFVKFYIIRDSVAYVSTTDFGINNLNKIHL